MPKYALSLLRTLLNALLGPFRSLSIPLADIAPASSSTSSLRVVTHSVHCSLSSVARPEVLDFPFAIHSIRPLRECRASVQDLSVSLQRVCCNVPVLEYPPTRVISTDALRADPATVVDTLRRPGDSLCPAVVSLPLRPVSSAGIRSFPIPSILTFNRRAMDVKAVGADAFIFRRDVRPVAVALTSIVKDGTTFSSCWRIRRRSLDIYRMPIEIWNECLEEFRRVKGLSPADLELAGVFSIPGGGLQDLAIDVERQSISFGLGGHTLDRLSLRTLLVARDRLTGALHALVRSPVAPRTRR